MWDWYAIGGKESEDTDGVPVSGLGGDLGCMVGLFVVDGLIKAMGQGAAKI